MKAHVIENGVVVNTIIVDSLDFMPGLVEATIGGPGWLYNGHTFTPPTTTETSTPTKEELLAQLQTLQSQIQALE